MTKEEKAFEEFEKKYNYDWYAQPDGGSKTVVFTYYEKGMYLNGSNYEPPVKFEAESLEKAFNYAFFIEKLVDIPANEYWDAVGSIRKFNINKWSIIDQPKYYTTASGVVKCLKDVLDAEIADRLKSKQ